MTGFAQSELRRRSLIIPLALCAALNVGSLLAIAWYHPAYFGEYQTNPMPDAVHYVLLGRNLFLHREFSRSQALPYVPDVFRTPAYPAFAGALDLIGGIGLVYIVQALLHCLTVFGVYRLADRAFGERAAFFSALFIAIHPTLLVLNVQAMSEPLFVFLIVLSAVVLSPPGTASARPWRCFAAGNFVGLATLVRPAGLYLPLALTLYVGAAVFRTHRFREAGRRATALLLGAAVWIAPWIVRNSVEFGLPTLTTNDTIVLLYFTGAGAYQVHYGIDRDIAASMIPKEYGIHSAEDMWNYHIRGLPPAAMDREARRAIIPVLTRFPAELCESCALGLAKAMFSHDAGTSSAILNLSWTSPGMSGLIHLNRSAWSVLLANHPLLIGVFAAPFAVNAILVPLSLAGAVIVLRRKLTAAYLPLLLFAFFALTCAASGIDAYTRFSAPILPFAPVLAGLAAAELSQRLRRSWSRTFTDRAGPHEQLPVVHGLNSAQHA